MKTTKNIALWLSLGGLEGFITEGKGVSKHIVCAKKFPSNNSAMSFAVKELKDYVEFLKPVKS